MTKYFQHRFSVIQMIAMFEALKGILALLAGIGLLSLLHQDIHQIALNIIGHYSLNEHSHLTSAFLHWTEIIQNENRFQLALFGVAYIGLRFLEAYGLWNERSWAEWLAALSGGIYLPLEIIHLVKHLDLSGFFVLICNALIVGYLLWQLVKHKQTNKAYNHIG
jgi:uncharacterized membrane protein (DUF2068 family)